jgi:DNA polymerase I
MEKFVEIVQNENPDIILGYNSDAFDFPYLQERARQLGVTLNLVVDGSKLKFTRVGMGNAAMIRGRVHIDLYSNLRRYLQLDSYTLENVYKEFFREEKLDIPGDEIYRYWDAGGERLKNLLTIH